MAAQTFKSGSGKSTLAATCDFPAADMSSPSYVNMDYIFANVMQFWIGVSLFISYDIACQWFKHLRERLSKFPPALQIKLPDDTRAVVPKLHFSAHEQKNHSQYSANLIPGMGRTDGEGIERRWWFVQPIAASTIGMGPGRRQNVLEDHWGYSNWRKYVGMCESIHTYPFLLYLSPSSIRTARTLKKRLLLATKELDGQRELFDALTASIKNKALVHMWRKQVEAWEADPSLPDPYYVATQGMYMLCLTQVSQTSLQT